MKKSSLLYYFLTTFGMLQESESSDFCTITKAFLQAFAAWCSVVCVIAAFSVPVVVVIAYALSVWFVGWHQPDTSMLMCMGFVVAYIVILAVVYIRDYMERRKQAKQAEAELKRRLMQEGVIVPEVQPSALRMMWRSFHEKTCFKVTFTE